MRPTCAWKKQQIIALWLRKKKRRKNHVTLIQGLRLKRVHLPRAAMCSACVTETRAQANPRAQETLRPGLGEQTVSSLAPLSIVKASLFNWLPRCGAVRASDLGNSLTVMVRTSAAEGSGGFAELRCTNGDSERSNSHQLRQGAPRVLTVQPRQNV